MISFAIPNMVLCDIAAYGDPNLPEWEAADGRIDTRGRPGQSDITKLARHLTHTGSQQLKVQAIKSRCLSAVRRAKYGHLWQCIRRLQGPVYDRKDRSSGDDNDAINLSKKRNVPPIGWNMIFVTRRLKYPRTIWAGWSKSITNARKSEWPPT